MPRILLAFSLCLVFAAAQAHDDSKHSIDRVNGGIRAEAGQAYGDLSTVNGGITIASGATAEEVETVNGGVTIDDNATVTSASTVNGGITAGEKVRVNKDLETVNGGIRVNFNSNVGGDIGTVNGAITVRQTEVGGRIRTINGDITIGARSLVHGGILVEKPNRSGWNWGWGKQRIPRIVIGPDATVQGPLDFEREVELFVHTTAKIGKVTGATVQPYTDKLPEKQ